jgi:hypothetical protein
MEVMIVMLNRDTDIRACMLVDLPFLHRVGNRVILLDSETHCTRELYGTTGVILNGVLIPHRNLYTFTAKLDQNQMVGQFRMQQADQVAQIVYLAPDGNDMEDDTLCLHLLDAMAYEAGRQRASMLVGDVDEDSPLFETMRQSGFVLYSRQMIWRCDPANFVGQTEHLIRPVGDNDGLAVMELIARIVPSMLQPLMIPHTLENGWVYYEDNKLLAYIGVTAGRQGIYLTPYIDPSMVGAPSRSLLYALMKNIQQSVKLPVYMRVLRYHDWISSVLDELGFEAGQPQAIMVRHIKVKLCREKMDLVKHALKIVPNLIAQSADGHFVQTHMIETNNRQHFVYGAGVKLKGKIWKDA